MLVNELFSGKITFLIDESAKTSVSIICKLAGKVAEFILSLSLNADLPFFLTRTCLPWIWKESGITISLESPKYFRIVPS